MKPFHSFAMLAAIAAVSQAFAVEATTTPVGYVTESLKSGQFNVIGITTHQSVVASGVLDASTSGSVTDNEVNFTNLLTADTTYILELENGFIQEITAWSAGALTTPDDISGSVTAGTTKYKLRKATTLPDAFGATNAAGLQPSDSFDPSQADIVYVPNGNGGFSQFFYSSFPGFEGWFSATDFSDASLEPLVYADGIVVQRKGADLSVVLSGEIKTKPTSLALASGSFNYVGGVYPVGSTLATSGLQTVLTPSDSFDPSQADIAFVPDGAGSFDQYFYSSYTGFEGWFSATDFSEAGPTSVPSALVILRRGTAVDAVITPPTSYNTL